MKLIVLCQRMLFLLVALALPARAGEPAKRIVVLGGAITEIVYALHAEDRVVGLDTTSTFPPEALKSKPNVGYVRALSAEGILSLKPDLILAVPNAGPPDAIDLVKGTGVAYEVMPEAPTREGVVVKITAVGAAVGKQQDAEALADKVAAEFGALAPLRAKIKAQKRVLFLLSAQNGRAMAAGKGTSADAIIRLAGARNAVEVIDGFKPLSDEAIIAAAPDAVLVMTHAGPQITADRIFAMPAFAATPAAKARAFVAMDGLLLLGFGLRSPAAARQLLASLYPDIVAPMP